MASDGWRKVQQMIETVRARQSQRVTQLDLPKCQTRGQERDALPAKLQGSIDRLAENIAVHTPVYDLVGPWLKALAFYALALGREQGRQEERARCAEIARMKEVMHGDHYAGYFAPSTDGEAIAAAIEGREGAGR